MYMSDKLDRIMTRTYFLKTERIGFSRWCADDLALAEKLWGNPKVTHFISAKGMFTHEEIQNRLQTEIHNGKTSGIQYWPVFDLASGDFLGCCGLRPYDEGIYEAGIHLLPEYWHQGYAQEALSAVSGYAFSVLNAAKLFAGHHPQNAASRRLLQKAGFRYVRDEYYPPTGLNHPSYELANPEQTIQEK